MISFILTLFIFQSPAYASRGDFQLAIAHGEPTPPSKDCRRRISNVLCIVDPPNDPNDDRPRRCLSNPAEYALRLEEVYDILPAHLQKMFCHLSRINVEKDFIGSAYGGLELESDKQTVRGGLLGIRETLLKGDVSLNRWASWKEQTHFGTDPLRIEPLPNLPRVEASHGDDPRFMLYMLIAHEFGHIFDFVNGVNQTFDCRDEHCPIKPRTFGAISFERHQIPLPQFDFPMRSALCFYFCEGKFIEATKQDILYAQLAGSNFATPYTTRYEQEDFADTFALYTMRKEWKMNYVIRTASGATFDPMARLESEDLRPKREFIERFLKSNYQYPGVHK